MSEENNEYIGLHNLEAPRKARRPIKRVGRGESSGHGKTSGRGHKGQKARKSGHVRPGFEGGQMPLSKTQPKRGFSNHLFRKKVTAINIGSLAERFEAGAEVNQTSLIAAGLINKLGYQIKILAQGELEIALNLKVHAISTTAKEKVEKAGGTVELIK